MTRQARWTRRIGFGVALTAVALAAGHSASAETPASAARDTTPKPSRVVFAHALSPLDGRHLKATMVEVRYGPGGSSPAHQHPCPVIGYVLEGALRTQVQGEPAVVYRAGEAFYERANQVHLVSANASQTDSVRFLATSPATATPHSASRRPRTTTSTRSSMAQTEFGPALGRV